MSDRDPSVIALSRFRAELTRSLTKRGKKLLESPALPTEVAALTPLESYFVVKELGSDTALPILEHFTDEQFQTLIDIDGWFGGEPQHEDIDAWLAVYATLGPDALATAFLRLDPELQTLHMRARLTVWDPSLDAVPEPQKKARRKDTPDGFYTVEARDELDWEIDPFALLDAVYRFDIKEGTRQMLTARAEQSTLLKEDAFRFRSGRLEDWGFPSRDRAMRIFTAPLTDEPPYERPAVRVFSTVPALYAAPLTEGSLFMRTLSGIEDGATLRALQEEVVFLVNAAVVGFGGSVRDVDHVLSITERVRDTLSLGLEVRLRESGFLGSTDEDIQLRECREIIHRTRLESVFRSGHFEIEQLGRTARSLAQDPVVAHWLDREDSEGDDYRPERANRHFMRALVDFPSTFAGFDLTRPERKGTIRSWSELEALRERIQEVVAQVR